MRHLGLALCLFLAPLAAVAQTDDRDYLTAFIEDSLSGAGRTVVVTGFQGALSARATVEEITIADDQGIWLTLRGVTMDWSRSALLLGQINVSDLSAQEIIVDRMPATEASAATPEAGSFALPELPVSLRVDHLGAEHIHLGAGVLGQEVDATLAASMALAGGEGQAQLSLQRTDDGPAGRVALTASYANADQHLAVDLVAEEAAGGIAATLLRVPGAPATALSVKGDGPLADFTADVALATDGVNRLAGTVTLHEAAGGQGFGVDLAGDLAPLFLPDYAAFFGDSIKVKASGTRWVDGRLALDQLTLAAAALQLHGQLSLNADGLPQRFDLAGQIAHPQGGAVLLPYPVVVPTRIDSANLTLHFDAAEKDLWAADIAVQGLDRADFRAEALTLNGAGHITRGADGLSVDGVLSWLGRGLQPADADLARALGETVTGSVDFGWHQGDGRLSVHDLELAGVDYGLSGTGKLAGLGEALELSGTARLRADDLARFAGVAGQPLGGAGTLFLSGTGSPLTGAFDIEADLRGRDLRIGIPQADAALRGDSVLTAALSRDTSGTSLHSLHLSAGPVTADASGTLSSSGSILAVTTSVSDLSRLGNGLRGSLSATGQLSGVREAMTLTLDATGRGLGIGQDQADRLLAGESRLALGLTLRDGTILVDRADLSNPQLSVQAKGALRGDQQTVTAAARLNNLGTVMPDFPGALTVNGTLVQTAAGTQVDLAATGPGQIDARVNGRFAPDFRSADLTVKGTSQAGLANAFIAPRVLSGRTGFDLRLNGPLALSSLSGTATLSDGRLADPMLFFSLDGISGRADLAGGRAQVTGSGRISSGGTVELRGSAGLTPPYTGDFSVDIRNAVVRDPDLYEARLAGNITISGPLLGGAKIAGRINLADTEVRVPSANFGAAGGLPDLQHRNEPHPVRETRARAGLVEAGPAAQREASRPYLLDLLISAPARLFVRGRGLDMELGGELRLTGTTASVVPVGGFDLIRGRLEILSRRLDLTTASLQLQGAFVPYIHVVATAQSDGATVGVDISGRADDPVVSFTSSPDMPDEEILARLLFGSNVQNLSVLQAIELANAVRTLAGNGGEGVISKLRQNLGLDNLDLKTNAAGESTLTVGKYLTKNIYTELSVDAKGQSEIHLNLDVTPSVTVRGTAASDGNSSLGVFVERDY